MKLRKAIIGSTLFLLAVPALAQTRPATTAEAAKSDAPTRVAVINIQTAIASTDEGKQAAQELQTRFTPRQSEIDTMSKQLQGLQQRMQDGQNTLSDQEKERLGRQYQQLSRQVQRKQQELQDDFQDARTDTVDTIGQKMMRVIDRYANENGFSVVLDTSSQTSPVLFATNSVDITKSIITLYNQSFPVKAAAAAPKPKPKP
jgi:outer membrane protein